MITLYGIPNCDTVKKARDWLAAHAIAYTFYDFKKQGVPKALASAWLQAVDWSTLINRKGTTWRKLSPAEQQRVVDAQSALALMLDQPAVIKRPILMRDQQLLSVGFDATLYAALFSIES